MIMLVQTGHTHRKTTLEELHISSSEEEVTNAIETSMFPPHFPKH